MNIPQELAVQSFCYRGFKSNQELIAKVKETGLARVELCGVHVDFSDESAFETIIGEYRDAGVEIVSIGVNPLKGDEASERKLFDFVRLAGAKYMSVDFHMDKVREATELAGKLAEEYDVRLGIHNHGGRHWLGSTQAISHVLSISSDRIGLCLDTAWCLHSGEDPVKMTERFGDRLYGVHLKDFIFDKAGKHQDVVVGTGNLDLPRLKQTLDQVGFDGYAVLEYEGDVENPVPALKECVSMIGKEMG